jgi:hypothetical protein
MSSGRTILWLGMSLIILYAVTVILNFYGVGPEVYGMYIIFYLFMLLTIFILPNTEPKV